MERNRQEDFPAALQEVHHNSSSQEETSSSSKTENSQEETGSSLQPEDSQEKKSYSSQPEASQEKTRSSSQTENSREEPSSSFQLENCQEKTFSQAEVSKDETSSFLQLENYFSPLPKDCQENASFFSQPKDSQEETSSSLQLKNSQTETYSSSLPEVSQERTCFSQQEVSQEGNKSSLQPENSHKETNSSSQPEDSQEKTSSSLRPEFSQEKTSFSLRPEFSQETSFSLQLESLQEETNPLLRLENSQEEPNSSLHPQDSQEKTSSSNHLGNSHQEIDFSSQPEDSQEKNRSSSQKENSSEEASSSSQTENSEEERVSNSQPEKVRRKQTSEEDKVNYPISRIEKNPEIGKDENNSNIRKEDNEKEEVRKEKVKEKNEKEIGKEKSERLNSLKFSKKNTPGELKRTELSHLKNTNSKSNLECIEKVQLSPKENTNYSNFDRLNNKPEEDKVSKIYLNENITQNLQNKACNANGIGKASIINSVDKSIHSEVINGMEESRMNRRTIIKVRKRLNRKPSGNKTLNYPDEVSGESLEKGGVTSYERINTNKDTTAIVAGSGASSGGARKSAVSQENRMINTPEETSSSSEPDNFQEETSSSSEPDNFQEETSSSSEPDNFQEETSSSLSLENFQDGTSYFSRIDSLSNKSDEDASQAKRNLKIPTVKNNTQAKKFAVLQENGMINSPHETEQDRANREEQDNNEVSGFSFSFKNSVNLPIALLTSEESTSDNDSNKSDEDASQGKSNLKIPTVQDNTEAKQLAVMQENGMINYPDVPEQDIANREEQDNEVSRFFLSSKSSAYLHIAFLTSEESTSDNDSNKSYEDASQAKSYLKISTVQDNTHAKKLAVFQKNGMISSADETLQRGRSNSLKSQAVNVQMKEKVEKDEKEGKLNLKKTSIEKDSITVEDNYNSKIPVESDGNSGKYVKEKKDIKLDFANKIWNEEATNLEVQGESMNYPVEKKEIRGEIILNENGYMFDIVKTTSETISKAVQNPDKSSIRPDENCEVSGESLEKDGAACFQRIATNEGTTTMVECSVVSNCTIENNEPNGDIANEKNDSESHFVKINTNKKDRANYLIELVEKKTEIGKEENNSNIGQENANEITKEKSEGINSLKDSKKNTPEESYYCLRRAIAEEEPMPFLQKTELSHLKDTDWNFGYIENDQPSLKENTNHSNFDGCNNEPEEDNERKIYNEKLMHDMKKERFNVNSIGNASIINSVDKSIQRREIKVVEENRMKGRTIIRARKRLDRKRFGNNTLNSCITETSSTYKEEKSEHNLNMVDNANVIGILCGETVTFDGNSKLNQVEKSGQDIEQGHFSKNNYNDSKLGEIQDVINSGILSTLITSNPLKYNEEKVLENKDNIENSFVCKTRLIATAKKSQSLVSDKLDMKIKNPENPKISFSTSKGCNDTFSLDERQNNLFQQVTNFNKSSPLKSLYTSVPQNETEGYPQSLIRSEMSHNSRQYQITAETPISKSVPVNYSYPHDTSSPQDEKLSVEYVPRTEPTTSFLPKADSDLTPTINFKTDDSESQLLGTNSTYKTPVCNRTGEDNIKPKIRNGCDEASDLREACIETKHYDTLCSVFKTRNASVFIKNVIKESNPGEIHALSNVQKVTSNGIETRVQESCNTPVCTSEPGRSSHPYIQRSWNHGDLHTLSDEVTNGTNTCVQRSSSTFVCDKEPLQIKYQFLKAGTQRSDENGETEKKSPDETPNRSSVSTKAQKKRKQRKRPHALPQYRTKNGSRYSTEESDTQDQRPRRLSHHQWINIENQQYISDFPKNKIGCFDEDDYDGDVDSHVPKKILLFSEEHDDTPDSNTTSDEVEKEHSYKDLVEKIRGKARVLEGLNTEIEIIEKRLAVVRIVQEKKALKTVITRIKMEREDECSRLSNAMEEVMNTIENRKKKTSNKPISRKKNELNYSTEESDTEEQQDIPKNKSFWFSGENPQMDELIRKMEQLTLREEHTQATAF